jgi:hypothetical protein
LVWFISVFPTLEKDKEGEMIKREIVTWECCSGVKVTFLSIWCWIVALEEQARGTVEGERHTGTGNTSENSTGGKRKKEARGEERKRSGGEKGKRKKEESALLT